MHGQKGYMSRAKPRAQVAQNVYVGEKNNGCQLEFGGFGPS